MLVGIRGKSWGLHCMGVQGNFGRASDGTALDSGVALEFALLTPVYEDTIQGRGKFAHKTAVFSSLAALVDMVLIEPTSR